MFQVPQFKVGLENISELLCLLDCLSITRDASGKIATLRNALLFFDTNILLFHQLLFILLFSC